MLRPCSPRPFRLVEDHAIAVRIGHFAQVLIRPVVPGMGIVADEDARMGRQPGEHRGEALLRIGPAARGGDSKRREISLWRADAYGPATPEAGKRILWAGVGGKVFGLTTPGAE